MALKVNEKIFWEKIEEKKDFFNIDLIKKAFYFAKRAHKNQKRVSGEPYFIHPLTVAYYLLEWNLDEPTIIAGLLHDVVEDTSITIDQIREEFGEKIAELVDGVTKLKKIKSYREKKELESLRKMFVAMARDVRVVLIRLADRLHNLQTLRYLPPEKRKEIAQETIEIYAPLADRLGMGQIRGELEDLAFPYFLPKEYRWLRSLIKEDLKEKHLYVKKVIKFLRQLLRREGIKFIDIHGRVKHFYSLYRKLLRHNKDISKIYDLEAVRIIVPTIEDCYKALGVIHKHFKPLIGRIKDYISMPKPNGYRALHTTVFALEGKIIEIQIKTPQMHQEAEWGIASHIIYADNKESIIPSVNQINWIKQLSEWQKEISNLDEFAEILKKDVFGNRIYVFTPKGDIKELPEGATPVDFAYAVHTEVGNKCIGAKVNGKIVPLDTPLNNGDIVEILTSKRTKGPSRDWLSFVKTKEARSKIRSWFKKIDRQTNLEEGKKILKEFVKNFFKKNLEEIPEEKLEKAAGKIGFKNLEDLFVALGEGVILPSVVAKELEDLKPPQKTVFKIKKETKAPKIIIDDNEDILYKLASCCRPKPGDLIIGYLVQGGGVTIHKKNCKNILNVKDQQRLVKATWQFQQITEIALEIEAFDRIGLLKDIGEVASRLEINLKEINSKTQPNGIVKISLVAQVKSINSVESFLRSLKTIKGIQKIIKK